MLTCKNALPDSPHLLIITKNPGFRALYLATQNEFCFFSFNKYKKIFPPFLAVGFCLKNLAFAPKIVALPESGGSSPSPSGSYAYKHTVHNVSSTNDTLQPPNQCQHLDDSLNDGSMSHIRQTSPKPLRLKVYHTANF